jgi:hypothetical protein
LLYRQQSPYNRLIKRENLNGMAIALQLLVGWLEGVSVLQAVVVGFIERRSSTAVDQLTKVIGAVSVVDKPTKMMSRHSRSYMPIEWLKDANQTQHLAHRHWPGAAGLTTAVLRQRRPRKCGVQLE